jgi:hypothetical protein
MMTEIRGASNAKPKRELGRPTHPSWRPGVRGGMTNHELPVMRAASGAAARRVRRRLSTDRGCATPRGLRASVRFGAGRARRGIRALPGVNRPQTPAAVPTGWRHHHQPRRPPTHGQGKTPATPPATVRRAGRGCRGGAPRLGADLARSGIDVGAMGLRADPWRSTPRSTRTAPSSMLQKLRPGHGERVHGEARSAAPRRRRSRPRKLPF